MNAIGLSVGRLDVCHARIAPIHLHVVQPRFGLALAGVGREGGATLPCCDEHFVEESLPHLVDNDQVLEGSVGEVDACGSPERERRMAWVRSATLPSCQRLSKRLPVSGSNLGE